MAFIGDFEVDPSLIETTSLPVSKDIVLLVEKSERKTYEAKGDRPAGAYNWLQLKVVDFPGHTVFHTYFTNAEALSEKASSRSWKVFLDRLALPYTTSAGENGVAGIRIVGHLRFDEKREEYKLSKVIGRAQ